ncbi:MAG: multicopper oxidase family protein [Methylohalobius sp. ZOD2]
MTDKIDRKRRHLIRIAGIGAAALATSPAFPVVLKKDAFEGGEARSATKGFSPDVEIDMVAGITQAPILPGVPTRVWKYEAKVVRGDPGAVVPLPDTYLGPILKYKTGQKVRIRLHNRLPQMHITHWHGMHSPFEVDGHPSYAIQPGETYVYEFEVKNRACTNWYHPHAHGNTGAQAYAGLAGLLIVEDEEEQKLPLPRGEYDLPLVIQDRTFDDNNQLMYNRRGPIAMLGFLGERILVNGKPDFSMDVAGRAYRFRILNGSNSRVYKLAWSDGEPVTVIGTDGGLLERPVTRPYLMVGPGERYELWKDFSRSQGREVVLESLEYHGAMPPPYERHWGDVDGMMKAMGMMGGRGGMGMRGGMGRMGGMGPMALLARHIPQGSRFTVARFQVTRKAKDNLELPDRLRSLPHYRVEETMNPDKPRPIAIGNRGRQFTLNGRSFEMLEALPIETMPVNTKQLMEIFHAHGEEGMAMTEDAGHGGEGGHEEMAMEESGHQGRGGMMGGGMGGMNMAMMMAMQHPIHLHGEYFQIVKRTPPEAGAMHGGEGYETVKDGFVDEGFQDTVLVMPGERITLIKPFSDYKGLFVYHCHNLEHEDAEMMRNFKVV